MAAAGAPLVSSICAECGANVEYEVGALQVHCEHCGAGLVVDRALRLVRLECPRCRGNFYYVDGSLCGACPYCEASLLALTRDRLLRYLVRPVAPRPEGAPAASLRLLPFWHLSGLLFGWDVGSKVEIVREVQIAYSGGNEEDPEANARPERRDSGPMKVFRGRVLDLSLADPQALAMGVVSLRLRGAVFPVEPFSAEAEQLGHVVPPALDVTRAKDALFARAHDLGYAGDGITKLDLQRQDLVAETLSLLYYPFWVEEAGQGAARVWDAVSGEPEQVKPGAPPAALGATSAFDELRIIELTCEGCGKPLPGGNRSHIIPCAACGRFWHVSRQGLEPFTARWARSPRAATKPVWLPFWRVEAKVRYSGRQATRVADLRDTLGVMRPATQLPLAPPEAPLAYYVPAYGALRAPRLDYAARDLTRVQPLLEEGPRGPGEIFNCFFGAEDASRLGYVTLIEIAQGVVVSRLRGLRVERGEAELWYLPFEDRGRELHSLLTGTAYDWTTFRGVRH